MIRQSPRVKKLRKIAKDPIFPAALSAVHDQHARRRPIRKRLLRDELRRQLIIEVCDAHHR